jgi:hypothetical protein
MNLMKLPSGYKEETKLCKKNKQSVTESVTFTE